MKPRKSLDLLPILDILAILAWGILLFKYWLTGTLRLLIHPNYFGLVLITSIFLLILGTIKTAQFIADKNRFRKKEDPAHLALFPPGVGSTLLLTTAILGLLIAPGVLTSQTALQRGISESLPEVRSQPEAFRLSVKSEERSLIDWIRTLNAYPEPEAYVDQKVKVSGFVVHLPQLDDNYLMITRFILTCCAVDAYPVALPVKLETSRANYPPDTWLEIEGTTIVETLSSNEDGDKRQLVIAAKSLSKIPTPKDPYGY
ncbi:MAG: TIGR03943 family protein [Prochloraceae cyanobacterium]|nr:TIGR03943 family protein [Prochloraceae cyanobacterium]